MEHKTLQPEGGCEGETPYNQSSGSNNMDNVPITHPLAG